MKHQTKPLKQKNYLNKNVHYLKQKHDIAEKKTIIFINTNKKPSKKQKNTTKNTTKKNLHKPSKAVPSSQAAAVVPSPGMVRTKRG